MMPGWLSEYIGIPFLDRGRSRSGLDCWGLIRLVYLERLGIALPDHSTDYRDTHDDNALAEISARESEAWEKIEPGQEKIFDLIRIRINNSLTHVALVLPEKRMLHVLCPRPGDISTSNHEPYTSNTWKRRIGDFRRCRLMDSKPLP